MSNNARSVSVGFGNRNSGSGKEYRARHVPLYPQERRERLMLEPDARQSASVKATMPKRR